MAGDETIVQLEHVVQLKVTGNGSEFCEFIECWGGRPNWRPNKPAIVLRVSQKKVWREESRVSLFPILLLVQAIAMAPL